MDKSESQDHQTEPKDQAVTELAEQEQTPAQPPKQPQPQALRADILAFQPDVVEMEHRPLPGGARWTLYTVLALLVSAVTWASLSEIDRVVTASGKLITKAPNIVVQPLSTAIIRELNVKVGQVVKQGTVLATLDQTFTQADETQTRSQVSSLGYQMQRLKAELAGEALVNGETEGEQLQQAIYQRRKAEYEGRIHSFDERLGQLNAALQSNLNQQQQLKAQRALLQSIEDKHLTLQDSGASSELRLLEARNQRMNLDTQINRFQNERHEKLFEIRSLEAEKGAFQAEWRRQIAEELVETQREWERLKEQLTKAERLNTLVNLVAPADAVVLEMAKLSKGSVAREAEPLMTLVPINVHLEAEVEVPAKDIGRLREQDSARIKLDAFPFQRHGTLKGHVRTLSEDAFQKQAAPGLPEQTIYRARIALDTKTLDEVPPGFRLIPGMTVQTEIKVGTRTVISYFLYPVIRTLDEGLREP